MNTALSKISQGVSTAGRLGILRVVIAYPGRLREDVINETVLKEEEGHPLAIVEMDRICQDYEDLQTLLSLRQKRPAEEDEDLDPKRQRRTSERISKRRLNLLA
jgi:hypothetical protein